MKDIIMPQFDPEMKTGRVVEWLKKEGDRVEKGEPVVRIDIEKVSIDVESPESGILSKILVNPLNEVPAGTSLGSLSLEGEKGLVSTIGSSNPVSAISQSKPTRPVPQIRGSGVSKVVALSSMRQTIAEKMSRSWTQIPQVPLFIDVKLAEAEKSKSSLEKAIGKRVSINAIVAKAVANALGSFPEINCRFEDGEQHVFENVDVSIAVALDSGLITPVVRNANNKTVREISLEIDDLATRARSGRLIPSEVRGGTTTVSSLTGYGVDMFIPIINPPQATIVGVGDIRKDSRDNPYLTMTLVFDHRVTDGAKAAQLLQKIRENMENPHLLQIS